MSACIYARLGGIVMNDSMYVCAFSSIVDECACICAFRGILVDGHVNSIFSSKLGCVIMVSFMHACMCVRK